MSFTLLIFRHAKSDFDAATDHERILNPLGVQQAMFMGELLNEKMIFPNLVVCSSANRARQTMDLAMQAGKWECDSSITDALYNTTTDVMFEVLKQMSDQDDVVMVVGHEPIWSELANLLTGTPLSFNTAGLCSIDLDIERWSAIKPGVGKVNWYEHP